MMDKELDFSESQVSFKELPQFIQHSPAEDDHFPVQPQRRPSASGVHSPPSITVPTTSGGKRISSKSRPVANAGASSSAVTEAEKKIFLFLPLFNSENHEFGYLQSITAANLNKDNREYNHLFNSKKKRKDLDILFSKIIQQISFHTADLSLLNPASSLSSTNTPPLPPSATGTKGTNVSNLSTLLFQQYQLKLIHELNYSLLFSWQHFILDKIRNYRIFKLIIGVEMSYSIIHGINSLLMNAKVLNNPNLLKNELNSNSHWYNLYDVTSTARKLIKSYLQLLLSLSNQIINYQNTTTTSSGSASVSNINPVSTTYSLTASGGGNPSSERTSGATGESSSGHSGKYVVYVYSLIDDHVDLLYFTPESLIQLKFVV
jgi:hypothetical protein